MEQSVIVPSEDLDLRIYEEWVICRSRVTRFALVFLCGVHVYSIMPFVWGFLCGSSFKLFLSRGRRVILALLLINLVRGYVFEFGLEADAMHSLRRM